MLPPFFRRLGFNLSLGYALRTAVAACCAILLAWLAGLEHPQWSGMTVWAASQPMRGHLLEKSLFRILGTVVGAVIGILLLLLAQEQEWVIVFGLSAWVGVCAGVANLLRGFFSYGVMLAGYSAAMVSLLHSPGQGSDLAIGMDRMLTVLLGVLAALVVGLVFAKKADRDELLDRVDRLSVSLLRCAADRFSTTNADARQDSQLLIAEMASIEQQLDAYGAGSLRSKQAVRAIRRLMSAQVALLLWMQRPLQIDAVHPLSDMLRSIADAMEEKKQTGIDMSMHWAVLLSFVHSPALHDVLSGLRRAME